MDSNNDEVESLRIGTQMVNKNLGGFLEGFKREPITIDEYEAFLKFLEDEVEDEYFHDAIEETIAYLESSEIVADTDKEEDWFKLAEEFYEESEEWDMNE